MPTNGKRPPGRRLSLFAIDVEAEEKGTWEPLAPPFDCFEFLLRSLHCDDVQDWIANESAREQKLNRNVELPGKTQAMIFRRAVGEKLIVDWKGLLDDAGKPIAFSRDLARDLMVERKWRHFADAISTVVLEKGRLRFEEDAAEGKESASSSSTVSA